MSQPATGDNFVSIGAAETTLIVPHEAALRALTVRGTGNGTLAVYNSATAAGTAAGNLILTVPFLSVVAPAVHPLNISFNVGIVATVTGTIAAGISWS